MSEGERQRYRESGMNAYGDMRVARSPQPDVGDDTEYERREGRKRRRRDRYGNDDVPDPVLEAYGNAPVMRTFQPSIPGGLDMLAAQLGQGYGSGGGDMASFLSNLYQPMNAVQFMEPISTTRSQFDAKKYTPIDTGNPYLDELLMKKPVDDSKKRKGRD